MARTQREQLEHDIEMLQAEISEREDSIELKRRAIEQIDEADYDSYLQEEP